MNTAVSSAVRFNAAAQDMKYEHSEQGWRWVLANGSRGSWQPSVQLARIEFFQRRVYAMANE